MLRGWINFAGQINWDFDNSGCLTLNYRNRHRQQTNVQHIFQHRHWRSDNSQSCKNIYIIQKRYKLNLLRCNIFKTMVGIDVNNCATTLRSNLDIYCITQLACSNNSILWLWSRKSHLWSNIDCSTISTLKADRLFAKAEFFIWDSHNSEPQRGNFKLTL